MTRPDARQLDLFAAPLAPPRDPAAEHQAAMRALSPAALVRRDRHDRPIVGTRAWSHGGEITLYHPDWPEPFEVMVRGVPCVIAYSGGVCTHAIDPPGSPFWSDTGFRSFLWPLTDPAAIVAAIEAFIDAPAKEGNGCGGRLKPWWPSCIHALRQRRRDWQHYRGVGVSSEYHANIVRWHDEGVVQVRALGFDPDVVAPWPAEALQAELV